MRAQVVSFTLLLLLPSALAFEARLDVHPGGVLVYPTDRTLNVTAYFEKGFFDDIEDIQYTISISGPATFPNNDQDVSSSIAQLTKSTSESYLLNLRDSGTSAPQSLRVVLEGTYVSNAYIGGGKKLLLLEQELTVVGTDRSGSQQVIGQLDRCLQELDECNATASNYATQRTQLEDSFQAIQAERDTLRQQVDAKQGQLILAWGTALVTLAALVYVCWRWYGLRRELRAMRELQQKRKPKVSDDVDEEEEKD